MKKMSYVTKRNLKETILVAIFIASFALIIIECANRYQMSITKENEEVKIEEENNIIDPYYDKFVEFLHNTSDAYDKSSEELLKHEYESWKNNTGYADIIINENGELESVLSDEEFEVKDVSDINYAIYTFSDGYRNCTVTIDMKVSSDDVDVDGALILSYISENTYCWFGSKIHLIDEENNIYEFLSYPNVYIQFTDYGTVIISNSISSDDEYPYDKYYPNLYTGEYLPVHSY